MPAPTNINAGTAVDIVTVPDVITQDVNDAGINYTVWYKYTAAVSDVAISLWGYGGGTSYQPILYVYSDAGITTIISGAQDVPVQIAVIPANTYYFQFVKNNNSSPAILTITISSFTATTAPIGSLFVNDDTTGFPLVILSSANGDVLQIVSPFPSGEGGDSLFTGFILVNDSFQTEELVLYDGQLVVIAELAYPHEGSGPKIRACHAGNKFYVGNPSTGGGSSTATTVLTNGTFGSTTWTLGAAGLRALAANNAETVLYFVGATSFDAAIHRWDLINDIALSDLAADISGSTVVDILNLADDTIIVGYYDSGTKVLTVKQYSAAGAVLNTYVQTAQATSTSPRLSYGLDDPDSFWVWLHNTGESVFINILVSDGSTIVTFTVPVFEAGVYQGAASAIPPDYGTSFSCPFFLMPEEYPATPPPTVGTITVIKVTSPVDATEFDYTSATLTPATFTLSNGQNQLYSDLDPGTYDVEETANPLYTTTYDVSNDSPHGAITLEAGEDVTVTVTNTLIPIPPPPGTPGGIYKMVPNKRNDTLWVEFPSTTEDVKIP